MRTATIIFLINRGSSNPQNGSCSVIHLTFCKSPIKGEQVILDTAGKVKKNSLASFSNWPLHMDTSVLTDQLCADTRYVLENLARAMADRSGWRERERERESREVVLLLVFDDDDDICDILTLKNGSAIQDGIHCCRWSWSNKTETHHQIALGTQFFGLSLFGGKSNYSANKRLAFIYFS